MGDSYDIVKRFWRNLLRNWAPLYAEPTFIPDELREDFTRVTTIPILGGNPPPPYSIFNDPDTGISLKDRGRKRKTHIAVETISEQLSTGKARCVVTFDQSFSFSADRKSLIVSKLNSLSACGYECFYYTSHAAFLFAVPKWQPIDELVGLIIAAGVPEARLIMGTGRTGSSSSGRG